MSTQPVYPAARAAAARIHTDSRTFSTTAMSKTRRQPSRSATVAFMIDAAFWASLRREESYSPLISLAFVSPEQAVSPLRFERSLLLGSKALTKLAAVRTARYSSRCMAGGGRTTGLGGHPAPPAALFCARSVRSGPARHQA